MANPSHLQSPASLSTEYDQQAIHVHLHQNGLQHPLPGRQAGSKRKRTAPRAAKNDERKKVSRACDCCKAKKVRCSGTQPCNRCHSQSLSCEYYAEHRRGRPASPEPGLPTDSLTSEPIGHSHTPKAQETNHGKLQAIVPTPLASSSTLSEVRKSTRSSQEAEETRFGGNYIGPASGIAFLHRAQRRFQQDFAGTMWSSSDGQQSTAIPVFSFGDGWLPDNSSKALVLPNKQHAKCLLNRYFDFAMPTYRFLHRDTLVGWLNSVYQDSDSGSLEDRGLSSAKAAIILVVFATAKLYVEDDDGTFHDGEAKDAEQSNIFFTTAEFKLSSETGPVRLESVQARLAQCIYLLASSRINQAWYIFGTAAQMILALGLHRKRYSQTSGATVELIEIECRKRVFWSAYTLDRYLSVILGRPRIFRDEDVDQLLPNRLNDADLIATGANTKSTFHQCVSDGPVFHSRCMLANLDYRLAQIIGGISSDLYPTNRTSGTQCIEAAERWTAELKAWKDSLPAFLEPTKVDPSILVPIFQRQSTVLRLAYAHALILANRSSLLSNFADLSRRKDLNYGNPEASVKECVDAAMLVVDTVNGFIDEGKMCKAFWFTHYISFCAIATLYVYTIQQRIPGRAGFSQPVGHGSYSLLPAHFEAAEKCQRKIVGTTSTSSPFRRYNIILDELKREVLHRLRSELSDLANFTDGTVRRMGEPEADDPSHLAINLSGGTPSITPKTAGTFALDFGAVDGTTTVLDSARFQPQGYLPVTSAYEFQTTRDASEQMYEGTLLDMGLFGSQGELIGWSEFDACAINWPEGFGGCDAIVGI